MGLFTSRDLFCSFYMPAGLGAAPGSLLGSSYKECGLSCGDYMLRTCACWYLLRSPWGTAWLGDLTVSILSVGKWEQKWLAKSSDGL